MQGLLCTMHNTSIKASCNANIIGHSTQCKYYQAPCTMQGLLCTIHNGGNIRHHAMQRLSGTMYNASIIRHHAQCKDYYAQCTMEVISGTMQCKDYRAQCTMQVLSGTIHFSGTMYNGIDYQAPFTMQGLSGTLRNEILSGTIPLGEILVSGTRPLKDKSSQHNKCNPSKKKNPQVKIIE